MSRIEQILTEARRLSRAQRKQLLAALQRQARAEQRAPRPQPKRSRSSARGAKRKSPYGSLLAVAGTVHSKFTDISSDKYKHVAAAIMGETD